MLRLVVLPQAFRVSLPPLGNQYLNLTKNTSLAIAVGYSDVVQIGQTIFNQTGRSLEVFAIWMLFYVACSLAISAVVNFFNVRLLIVER
jgi:general L-amino acid transport system permease protein